METEGKSNGSKAVKGRGDGRREGEDILGKKQDFNRWMNAMGCPKPLISPSELALIFRLCDTKEGEGEGEGERIFDKKQHVAMGMDVLDCPGCSTPLRPPIFQCSMGHLICSPCRDKLPKKACGVCSWAVLNRCHGMERVVKSIVMPCSFVVHGCADMIAYHQKAEHEKSCPHAPCFCPEKGCSFVGMMEALLHHIATTHDWPMTRFQYHVPFDIPVKAGMHVLRGCGEDGDLFLLRVASLDNSPQHGVSLVRVEPHARESKSGCSIGFSWFKGHYQVSTLDAIRSTSLSEGLPTDYFLTVPEACRGGGARVVLSVTIDTKMVYSDEDGLEEEDDDESYSTEENEDDDDSDEDEEDEDDDEDDDDEEDEDEDDEEDDEEDDKEDDNVDEEEEADDSDDNEEDDEDGEEEDDDDDDEDSWEEVSYCNDD